MKTPITSVFLVDDDLSVRNAMVSLLQAHGFRVESYASAQEYIDSYDPDAAGCLLLDLMMPGNGGLALQKILASREQAPPILFLTSHANVSDAVQALKGGAIEFLTKPVDDTVLMLAIRKALILDAVNRGKYKELSDIRKRLATLTPRERQVLGYVIAGKLNKQTASALGTVEKTIKVHRAHVMEKLQARSLARLIQISTIRSRARSRSKSR
jgi:FixJ family two-component response regulator